MSSISLTLLHIHKNNRCIRINQTINSMEVISSSSSNKSGEDRPKIIKTKLKEKLAVGILLRVCKPTNTINITTS
jgi:hypothetical protein